MDYQSRVFDGEDVVLDGNSYINCLFNDCNIFFEGGAFHMEDSATAQNSRWVFRGAAQRTLQLLCMMYRNPDLKGTAADILDAIKTGELHP